MEKSVNKVELSGFAGMNPEVKTLQSGVKMARLSMATDENYKNKAGEWVKETSWHNIIMWDKVDKEAEEKIHKGDFVELLGKIVNRNYTDANGNKHYITEIRAISFDVAEKQPIINSQPEPEVNVDLPF